MDGRTRADEDGTRTPTASESIDQRSRRTDDARRRARTEYGDGGRSDAGPRRRARDPWPSGPRARVEQDSGQGRPIDSTEHGGQGNADATGEHIGKRKLAIRSDAATSRSSGGDRGCTRCNWSSELIVDNCTSTSGSARPADEAERKQENSTEPVQGDGIRGDAREAKSRRTTG